MLADARVPHASRRVLNASPDASPVFVFDMAPAKRIHTAADLPAFRASPAYARIQFLLAHVSSSVAAVNIPSSAAALTPTTAPLLALLARLAALVDDHPPPAADTPAGRARRYGSPVFRAWLDAASADIDVAIDAWLRETNLAPDARPELAVYLYGALGSRDRIDYGTGHELSFLAFFGAAWFFGALTPADADLSGSDILYIFHTYFSLIRKLIKVYTLEPAGSHGVWGLDDHFHLPYIIGAAQLRGFEELHAHDMPSSRTLVPALTRTTPTRNVVSPATMRPPPSSLLPSSKPDSIYTPYGTPLPTAVLNKSAVQDLRATNMYFAAIAFIYDVKRGPFFEHSPVLYDISGVHSWSKIHSGLIKMYNAEVLAKFPVVQHFLFGSGFFPWT
ncbi:Phosphotyrosyl phosphatase activator [Limtongia smithiae]|uniref:Phosphotyrosyl phosphatase activator n=1 Tax=Limtongia smithiae TaxID=1125753 RepID=UPI0034CE3A84